jgi:hypothetical protein
MSVKSLSSSVSHLSVLRRVGAAAIAVMLTITGAVHAQEQEARRDRAPQPVVFTVDVAEDLAGKFVPTFVKPEHTQPERGSFFVTEGRIFPAGTISGDGSGFDPNSSGHIGVWICRGTHLVAASEIPAASLWVNTAQLFVLGRQGKEQIATEGVEGSGTVTRIVTGGAGNYAGFVGEQRQTFLGFNLTGGVNLRVTFTLWPVVDRIAIADQSDFRYSTRSAF